MTAIVLPDIDKATIDELRKKLPDLREIELPSMKEVSQTAKDVGQTAEETIDRLLGRSKAPVWPWVAAGIGLVAVIGAVAAYFAWWRRPAWETPSEPWAASPATNDLSTTGDAGDSTDLGTETPGLTAAESSLSSTSYNPQEA
jgi:hypothetical protein